MNAICYVDGAGGAEIIDHDGIAIAPGWGPMVKFTPREMVRTDAGNFVSVKAGYLGRDAARRADAFDLITMRARAAFQARLKKYDREAAAAKKTGIDVGPRPEFSPPFTHGQVNAGRDYAALSERMAHCGMKGASLEARVSGGGGGGGGVSEAILRDGRRLAGLHRRIGGGVALRKVRPSQRGRHSITVRALVDMVCLGDMTIADVLARHGWGKTNKRFRDALMSDLCAALDRLQGYR